MELKVAIVGKSRGWEQILSQIGINYEKLENVSKESLLKFPVAILTASSNKSDVETVKNYIETGGFLLTSVQAFYSHQTNKKVRTKFVKYLIPDNHGYFIDAELIELKTKIYYLDDAEYLKSNSGVYTTSVLSYGDGMIAFLPFDAGSLYDEISNERKSFYFTKNRLPHEKVSKISKGPIRRIVNNSLEYLFHSQNLVYCRKWQFPVENHNVFLFRIDTDYGNIKNINSIYNLAQEHGISISWFIDVKSQKDNIKYFKNMENQEIGLHCYEHKVFKHANEFENDIKTALNILKTYDIYPKGYAAVYGRWDKKVAEMIKNNGFSYSSEFSYDYDNLPSCDILENLQIPIHPICVGNLKRQGYTSSEMIKYYDIVIQRKISLNEPIVFYYHPNDGYLEVIHHIFNKIKNLNYQSYSFIEFSEWWKSRLNTKYSAVMDGNLLKLEVPNSSSCCLRITKKDNQETFISNSGTFNLDWINWKAKMLPLEIPKDMAKVYKPNIWKFINKIEDCL